MKEIDNINSRYEFYKISNINISIIVDSIKKLHDYNLDKKICEIIDENNYGIKYQLQNILINRKNYYLYNKEFDKFVDKIRKESSTDIVSKIKLCFKLLLIRLKRKKAQLNFNVNVLISYTSPARRNYYKRKMNYDYDDLVHLKLGTNGKKNIKKQQEIQKIKEEKSKNRNFIQCIYCNKLIDLNSIYCSYCGKRQIRNEERNYSDSSEQPNLYNTNVKNDTFLPTFDDNWLLIKKDDNSSKNFEYNSINKIEQPHNQMIENNDCDVKETVRKSLDNLFEIYSSTLEKYGIKIIRKKCDISSKYLIINYSIKLTDKSKLANNIVSIYVSIHEDDNIISCLEEVECIEFIDFKNEIIDGWIDISLEEININEILKIIIYAKKYA